MLAARRRATRRLAAQRRSGQISYFHRSPHRSHLFVCLICSSLAYACHRNQKPHLVVVAEQVSFLILGADRNGCQRDSGKTLAGYIPRIRRLCPRCVRPRESVPRGASVRRRFRSPRCKGPRFGIAPPNSFRTGWDPAHAAGGSDRPTTCHVASRHHSRNL